MKPQNHDVRPKNWIPFANFALVSETPAKLTLRDHLFEFEGQTHDPAFITGVYGTTSTNQAMFLISPYANRLKKTYLILQGWYQIDEGESNRAQIDKETSHSTGFLHLERVKKSYREELHAQLLDAAEEGIPGFRRVAWSDKPMVDLLVQHPQLVRALFANDRKLNMIVHPVRQMYDPSDHRTIAVATMRYIKSRIKTVEARYNEKIKVVY